MSSYGRKLFIGIAGIYFSYISLGYLAEDLFNTKFQPPSPENKEAFQKFRFPSLVTWVGCFFCSVYGLLYAQFRQKKPNLIPLKERLLLGVLFTLNYLPTNYALLFVSYPLQVVVKNSRYILVVIVGVFFSRVQKSKELQLPRSKLFIGILITFGAGLFMYYETNKQSKHFDLHPSKQWIGYALLLVAIICDALFSDSQAYCKANFEPTPNQLFLASNLYSFALIFAFSLLTGQLKPSLLFCVRHPSALAKLVGIGCLQVSGQVAVYFVISNFKQHIYPLMSTTRKILTILVSILIFNHSINSNQWLALVIVFLSMAYQLYDEVTSQQHHKSARKRKLQSSKEASQNASNIDTHLSSQNQNKLIDNKPHSQLQKNLNIANKSMRSSRSNKSERVNRFLNQTILNKQGQDDSLSKFRYSWRMGEVVDKRETSLTPLRNTAD